MGEVMPLKICDMDCFNCKFDHCINDKLTYEDYKQSDELSKEIKIERLGSKEAKKKKTRTCPR